MISIDTFFLDRDAPGTLQSRIQRMVAAGILSGRFRPGERLPSSRALAGHLGVARITVTLAYTELVADDYLTARGRSGYYVSKNAPEAPVHAPSAPGVSTVDWDALLPPVMPPSLEKPRDWATYRYNFIYGQADPTLFDAANWRLCALQSLGRRDFDSLTADRFDQDDPELVDVIAGQVLPRRGILARPDEILVTMGAQNALWMAAQLLLGPGRRAAIENPGYPSLRAILAARGAEVAAVDVDTDGLPPDAIPRGADVVFVTPSHQCPTTATMPLARRDALLARAEAEDMLIVEDDYDFEMSFLAPASPALKSLDRTGRVIHVGSFSKSIFPGLRLGYLVGPAPFIAAARALRASVLRHPPGMLQRTTATFLSLGHYDAQIRRTSRVLHERRRALDAAVAEHGLEVAGPGAYGGSALWMRAPEGVDTGELALALREKGVLVEPGGAFFAPSASSEGWRSTSPLLAPVGCTPAPTTLERFYRLAYSSIPEVRIAGGVGLIAKSH